ncbi:unnamed protein product [Schistosoma curassoni]|uniref:DUF655 domain-containing protein n=1 Tax=Schistosoma curassoni TaxID=6186 RepID=A0A183KXM4_9TREM|nr:unnamed protein product [Schistosoma curassoni]
MLRPPDADAAAILFVFICISSCVLDRRARSTAMSKSSNWFRAVHRIPCFPSDVEAKKALKIGKPGKISVEDVTYLVRRDPKKFSRVKELLLLSEELRRARKAFEEDEFDVLK